LLVEKTLYANKTSFAFLLRLTTPVTQRDESG
jgi:hypothetical protein